MRVFILEDDPSRIRLFREWLIGDEVTIADTCLDVLKFKPPYDMIFLDHDLGGRQMEHHPDNGEEFAKLIARDVNPDAHVIVHSFNPEGAVRIAAVMEDFSPARLVRICPFGFGCYNRIIDRCAFLAREADKDRPDA